MEVPISQLSHVPNPLWSLYRWVVTTLLDWEASLLPLLFLFVTFAISTFGPFWTLFSLGFIPISLNLLKKFFNIKDASPFYFSFTLYSILISFLIFELVTCSARFAAVTRVEYGLNLCLCSISMFFIYLTRRQCDANSNSHKGTLGDEKASNSALLGNPNPPLTSHNYNYCKKCRKTMIGRDHHCVWLNTCVGKSNKLSFLATVFFTSIWLFMTIMINLTSICYPVYLFNGWGLNDGSSTSGRWFLVPVQCPDVYQEEEGMATISFVISIYDLGVAILLMLILIHQLRLLYKGVSYLEYKYGTRAPKSQRRSQQ